jgi:hypothetical protein
MFGISRDEPRVDESVTLVCENPECFIEGEPYHPVVFSEFCGEPGHGGMVDHYTLDAFDCPECGLEGEEV